MKMFTRLSQDLRPVIWNQSNALYNGVNMSAIASDMMVVNGEAEMVGPRLTSGGNN